ncbi:MAG TPA: glutaredoxin family protein [Candidatus Limnocylindria bacterium]|nr:glutaredoxin family protein [Candidatus Limnocylindria bacterium]
MRPGNLRRALNLAFKRTPRGPVRRVLLYETEGCGLCAETFRQLSRVALDLPIEITRVDIASDPALSRRYALRVPVVAIAGREMDAAGAGEPALRGFVAAQS